ncbi:hypothetical protein RSJ42_12405 [Methanosarcina hadiensis]|uniref:hypothetical protein n=1 Tax=Methanosarcina hadiensis TaxID=3078083 RepID=UPI003977D753
MQQHEVLFASLKRTNFWVETNTNPVSGGWCPARVAFLESAVLFGRFAPSRGLT